MGNNHSTSSGKTCERLRNFYLVEAFTRDHSEHPIPNELKHLIIGFYCDKNSRRLLEEYDVLGEDADLYRKADSTKCMMRELSMRRRSSRAYQRIEDQLRIMTQLNHPNILKMYDVYHDRTEGQMFLVYECFKVPLVDVIIGGGRIDEGTAKNMMKQLLLALTHIHSLGIVHGKIKPKTLMTSSQNVDESSTLKLMFTPQQNELDGDQVIEMDNVGVLTVRVCSPYCTAPEVLTHRHVGTEGDMWSVGVVLYIMLVGFPPFWTQPLFDDGNRKLKSRIIDGVFTMPPAYWDTVSDGAKDLVLKLLQTNPPDRLTAKEALDHKWFTEK